MSGVRQERCAPPLQQGGAEPEVLVVHICSRPTYPYSITQHPRPSFRSPDSKLCLVAASNTSSTPSPVRDEHSKYFLALILLRTSSPSSGVRNFSDRLRISSCATGSSRKSFFRPTRIMGTPGQRSRTSGCLIRQVLAGSYMRS